MRFGEATYCVLVCEIIEVSRLPELECIYINKMHVPHVHINNTPLYLCIIFNYHALTRCHLLLSGMHYSSGLTYKSIL